MAKKPQVEHKKIAALTPDPHNANVGTERGLSMLDDSLSSVGLGRSVVTDRNGVIIGGNKTVERSIDRGFEDAIIVHTRGQELVVVQRDDLDLASDDPNNPARKLAYYDNRVAQTDLLWNAEQILKDVNAGVKLDALFSEAELAILLAGVNGGGVGGTGDPGAQLERATQLREKWQVERGMCWTIGRHRLLCGDAYNADHLAQLLNGATPAMLHTDPPYGVNIVKPKNAERLAVGESNVFGGTNGAKRLAPGFARREGATGRRDRTRAAESGAREPAGAETGSVSAPATPNSTWIDGRPRGSAGSPSRTAIVIQSNTYPVIEGDDHPFDPAAFLTFAPIVILWGANYYADRLPISSCWVCWDKREDITRNDFADCELAWTNLDKPARVFHHLWNGLHKGSQWGERRIHPTEKPVALFAEIGRMFCPDGVWVDLFAGSGAQVVAAESVGAACYALEYEPLYVACILERLSALGLTPERQP